MKAKLSMSYGNMILPRQLEMPGGMCDMMWTMDPFFSAITSSFTNQAKWLAGSLGEGNSQRLRLLQKFEFSAMMVRLGFTCQGNR